MQLIIIHILIENYLGFIIFHALGSGYTGKFIIVDLKKIKMINNIEFSLMDHDGRSYSYYVDVSVDGIEYTRLIDRTAFYYRSLQLLHFPSRPVQFIKLVGTRAINIPQNTVRFQVAGFKAMYTEGRDTVNSYLRPTNNIANLKTGAFVLEGAGGNNMLNDNLDEFTCHNIGQGCILLQLNEPYHISSIRMLLGCNRNYSNGYSFYIETSLDKEKWQMAVDKREESLSGWQQFSFTERPVIFIKIIGTKKDIVSSFCFSIS